MQDGALAHRFLTVRERVTEVLIIVQWHCSIKISGLQDHQTFILLFLWGYMKFSVFATPPMTIIDQNQPPVLFEKVFLEI